MVLLIALLSSVNMILITLLVIVIIWCIQYHWYRRNMYILASKIPHVNCTSYPLIGIAHILHNRAEDILNLLLQLCAKNKTTKAWVGHRLMCLIYKPEDIEIVLNSKYALEKHEIYKTVKLVLGDGLLTAPVPKWKAHRKAMLPTFNQQILNNFVPVFVNQSNILVEMLKNDVGATFDIKSRLGNFGIDSICETAIGIKTNAQTSNSELVQAMNKAMEVIAIRTMNFLYHTDFIFQFTALYRQGIKSSKYIRDNIDKILITKYKKMQSEQQNKFKKNENKFKPFLDLFMELKYEDGKLTSEELKDETTAIYFGGSDTSKITVGFGLMMLGMFPDIQKQVYDEIVEVVGTDTDLIYTHLQQFKYLERFIKETLRIFPVTPILFRNAEEDIDITDYTIPKGSGIGIATIMVQRSPDYWVDPLKFDPDRFLPAEISKRHPYTYIPFSAGPRNCIGYKYAMMSMKTVIATILREFSIETPYTSIEDIKCTQDMLIKPIEGFKVKLTQRKL